MEKQYIDQHLIRRGDADRLTKTMDLLQSIGFYDFNTAPGELEIPGEERAFKYEVKCKIDQPFDAHDLPHNDLVDLGWVCVLSNTSPFKYLYLRSR